MLSLLSLFVGLIICCQLSIAKSPKLLVLGMDGFRWDYTQYANTPNFDRMAEEGVHATHGMKTTFVASTYPAYWTISTGLHPETHGIVDNHFWDPVHNESFRLGKSGPEDPKWWAGEPIWVTAKMQGKKVALNDWIANWITFNGTKADFVIPQVFNYHYNGSYTEEELFRKIDSVKKWLIDDGCDLVMIYFDQPDHEGHKSGALSNNVVAWIEKIDTFLGMIFDVLTENNIIDEVNVIAFSDHGMVNITFPAIDLADIIDIKQEVIRITGAGAFVGITPQTEKLINVYKQLKANCIGFTVYLKDDIPEDRHYKNSDRVPPIVLTADERYFIDYSKDDFNVSERSIQSTGGIHGYDSNVLNMNPMFYARGPNFKQHYATDVFETVNLYSLMSYLLRIKESPNDGSLANVQHMLNNLTS